MQKLKAFDIKTTGILISAIYSSVIFLRGIFIDVFIKPDVFFKTIFEYRVLTGRLFSISFCVFLFLLYFYNKDKIKLKALKINFIAACVLLVFIAFPSLLSMINALLMQANGFELSNKNLAQLNILYILRNNFAIFAFMLLIILKYKKTLTAIFISLEMINLISIINLQIYAFDNLQKYGSQLANAQNILFENLFFMLLSVLNIVLLSLYAIKVELKRNQTDNS
jgi:hypothetical protein